MTSSCRTPCRSASGPRRAASDPRSSALSAAVKLRLCSIVHLTSSKVKCCDDQLNPRWKADVPLLPWGVASEIVIPPSRGKAEAPAVSCQPAIQAVDGGRLAALEKVKAHFTPGVRSIERNSELLDAACSCRPDHLVHALQTSRRYRCLRCVESSRRGQCESEDDQHYSLPSSCSDPDLSHGRGLSAMGRKRTLRFVLGRGRALEAQKGRLCSLQTHGRKQQVEPGEKHREDTDRQQPPS